MPQGDRIEHVTKARSGRYADARHSLRPRHVGHVLEWLRTACAVAAVTLQCVVLIVLLTR